MNRFFSRGGKFFAAFVFIFTIFVSATHDFGRPSGGIDGSVGQLSKYDEFRDCVGYYWWLPGVNVVACAIGTGVSMI